MKKYILMLALVSLLCFQSSSIAWAQAPSTLAYQGYLSDHNQQPIQGSRILTFKLYQASDSTIVLWEESHVVDVQQGFFTTNLGSILPFPSLLNQYAELYLGVQVEQDQESQPRMKVGSALKAKWAENAVSTQRADHAVDVSAENIHPRSVSIGDRLVINEMGQWVGETIRGLQGPQGIQGPQGEQGIQGPQGAQGPVGDSCIIQPLVQNNGQAVPGIIVLKCGNNPEIRLSVYQCGNGQIDQGETCDDGNVNANDGCDYHCKSECGNSVLNGIEQCDDGNNVDTDSCNNNCLLNRPCGVNCPTMEMVLIEVGSFNMGSNTFTNEQPIHNVQIHSNFYVGKTEVTVEQYRACVNVGQCTAPDGNTNSTYCNWTSSVGAKENHPVNCIDWRQARTFAKWVGGDLLTEAQWEYVATAQGQTITYPWGNEAPTCQLTNFSYCVNYPNGNTAPVCSTIDGNTAQGVCDMGGNVSEWVLDEYHGSYNGAPTDGRGWCSDMECSSNTSIGRLARGGCWYDVTSYLRSASRPAPTPSYRDRGLGFRVSRYVP